MKAETQKKLRIGLGITAVLLSLMLMSAPVLAMNNTTMEDELWRIAIAASEEFNRVSENHSAASEDYNEASGYLTREQAQMIADQYNGRFRPIDKHNTTQPIWELTAPINNNSNITQKPKLTPIATVNKTNVSYPQAQPHNNYPEEDNGAMPLTLIILISLCVIGAGVAAFVVLKQKR